jgi:transcriptional regulator with XRE-family HTH domain
MNLPEKLKMLCGRRGWKQVDLAHAAKRETGRLLSRSSVNNWFLGKGKPDLDSALSLAKTLGVSLDYLADDSQDEPPQSASLRVIALPGGRARITALASDRPCIQIDVEVDGDGRLLFIARD